MKMKRKCLTADEISSLTTIMMMIITLLIGGKQFDGDSDGGGDDDNNDHDDVNTVTKNTGNYRDTMFSACDFKCSLSIDSLDTNQSFREQTAASSRSHGKLLR
uniref:Uncharacterized protein n=1 Tax=Glossina palpalis gambiensis TaxID=67801 RepID=A0A1B0B8D4_9MUSC